MARMGQSFIREPIDALKHLKQLRESKVEKLATLFLDRSNRLIAIEVSSSNSESVHSLEPKVIFERAILHKADRILIAHNHPSGNEKPSKHDIKTTHHLMIAGKVIGIILVDHLVVTTKGYTSFREIGLL